MSSSVPSNSASNSSTENNDMASPVEWNGYKVSAHNMFTVDPRAVEPDADVNITRGRQPILEDEDLRKLALQMASVGQINPITVRNTGKGHYKVVSGFRRHKAALWLIESGRSPDFKLKCMPATLNDRDAALRNFSENAHRADPSPMEMARAINILMVEHGMSREQVAEATDRSPGWVDYSLGLLSLPASIQSAVEVGDCPVTAAIELGKLPEGEQEEAFEELTQEGNVSAEGARQKRRDAGQTVKRGLKPLKEFLKLKGQEGECGSEAALLLLDLLDGKVTPDDASRLWDKFTLNFMNCIVPEEAV